MPKVNLKTVAEQQEAFEKRYVDHLKEETDRFTEQRAMLDAVSGDIKTIKDNHLAHIEPAIIGIRKDLGWMKWLLLGMVAGMGGLLVSMLLIIFTKIIA